MIIRWISEVPSKIVADRPDSADPLDANEWQEGQ
jgi:hypothetical protein